jgi:hypothetical protein
MLENDLGYRFWQWFYTGDPFPHWVLITIVSIAAIIYGLWPEVKKIRTR